MKKTLLALATFSLILAACQTPEVPQDATPQVDPYTLETYSSAKFGLSFDYLEGLTVSEATNSNGSFLFISQEDYSNFEGEAPAVKIFLIEGQSMENRLEELKVTETEEEIIGENAYTSYTATSEFDGQEYTTYLLQDEAQLIEIHEGSESLSDVTLKTLLETLAL